MKKQIITAVISSMVGALIAFLTCSAMGLFEKTLNDSQVQKVAQLIVDNDNYRNVLLDKMVKSKQFFGPKGDTGPIGKTGPKGPGLILSMIIVKDRKVVSCTNGVSYNASEGIVTFPNRQNLKTITLVSDYGDTYITTTNYLRSDFEAINKYRISQHAFDTGGPERTALPGSFCAITFAVLD